MPLSIRSLFALVAVIAAAACGGDSPSGPTLRLEAVGRLERGSTVRIVARDGTTAADSVVTNVVVTPAAAGVVSGSSVQLLQSGAVTVSATGSDGRVISTQLTVAVPPTVFFDGVVAGNRDIYSVSLDGADLKRWTTSSGEESHPSVAAGLLVFSSTRDGNGELYSLPTAAGGAEKRLTTTAANETQPTLTANGNSIAYSSDAGGLPRVYVAPASLVGPARLTAASFGFSGSIESNATWSPIGDRIALMSTANGTANLFISPSVAGSTPAPVAGSGTNTTDVEPAWSPDGNRIAFASTRGGGTQLFVLDLGNGSFTQITHTANPSGQPSWLSDGRLLFTQFASSQTTLWWVDPAASAPPTQIPVTPATPAHAVGIRP